jgi:hypothetical protein
MNEDFTKTSVYTLYYPKSPVRLGDDPLYGTAEKRLIFRIQGEHCFLRFDSWSEQLNGSQKQNVWTEASMAVHFRSKDSWTCKPLVWKLKTGPVIPVNGNGVTARNLWDIMRSNGYIQ